ncbi:MAG: hypothetical protein CL878_10180 [Dehalococcoidia bacterium]|nr:hypothetical protein [Dehalococcoidia bacterium]
MAPVKSSIRWFLISIGTRGTVVGGQVGRSKHQGRERRVATDITFDFTGRAVFVTGGSNGIGLAIAQAFGEAGASVTISGTRASAGEYDGDLSRFTYTQLLMQDADQVESVIGSQLNLDVLVNCAGTVLRGREYEPDGFARIIRINLLGTQQASVAAHPLLKKSRGSIINIASMSSYFGFPRVPAYGASKTAVVSLTKSLSPRVHFRE